MASLQANPSVLFLAHSFGRQHQSSTHVVPTQVHSLTQQRVLPSNMPSGKHISHHPLTARAVLESDRSGDWRIDGHSDAYSVATVLHATHVSSGSDGFLVHMQDGVTFQCELNMKLPNPLPYHPRHAAMCLKVDDGSRTILPLLVPAQSSEQLLDALRGVPPGKPTVHMVMLELMANFNSKIYALAITHRENNSYHARLYFSKGDEFRSIAIRPSDGINIATVANVPILVNKQLASHDGVKIIGTSTSHAASVAAAIGAKRHFAYIFSEEDRASPEEDPAFADELKLATLMSQAVAEERYADAARLRDQLASLVTHSPTSSPSLSPPSQTQSQ